MKSLYADPKSLVFTGRQAPAAKGLFSRFTQLFSRRPSGDWGW